jgi:glucose-6-phosphate 1-epimerase
MNLPDSVTLLELQPGYPVYDIQHPAARARVALHGAHVMEWAPAGQAPVLYLSPQAVLEPGKAIRGGIPVCWPWFNAHPTDASKPMHGFGRNRCWTLADAAESAEGVRLVFTLVSDAETLALWPHAFRLQLEVMIGTALELTLTTENTDNTAFVLTEALHTYLAVADITQVSIDGLDGVRYWDTVGEPAWRQPAEGVVFDREVDRQYASTSGVTVNDPVLQRRLRVDKTGSGTTVVWNPWIDKSKRLADLPDLGFHEFLCVEAANAGEAAVRVEPGQRQVLRTRIAVEA